jgi:hypothetical protein
MSYDETKGYHGGMLHVTHYILSKVVARHHLSRNTKQVGGTKIAAHDRYVTPVVHAPLLCIPSWVGIVFKRLNKPRYHGAAVHVFLPSA